MKFNIKHKILLAAAVLLSCFAGYYLFDINNKEFVFGTTSVVMPTQGGTGASTIPTAGQIPVGQSNGKYIPTNTITATTSFTSSVGIGTTTPNGILTIKTIGTTDALKIFETGGTEIMTVRENGNVGIGRTRPDYPLEVNGSISVYDTANQSKGLRLMRNGVSLGGMNTDSSQVSFYATANNGLRFTVNSSLLSMIALPNGNIGIGTANPGYKLDIKNGDLRLYDDANVSRSFLFYRNSAIVGFMNSDSANFNVKARNAAKLFLTAASDTGITVDAAGNIGIGTTTPANILQVSNGTNTTTVQWGSSANGTKSARECHWNGASWTIETYAADSIVPIYTTSTSC